ncbi:hypothetical protein BGZ67_008282 [Mortierella alpina]|nr:hypothetical protein BGZ67_008282 [Mortierella alpina]
MLQSNDANTSVYKMTQSLPPQFFVDALLEYTGKKKRSSRALFALNGFSAALPVTSSGVAGAPNNNKSLGMWKNFSTTNISSPPSGSLEEPSLALHQIQQQLQPTFQQHLTCLLGKGEKRVLEEREQVLKKLRVLIRNGSIRWTGEFIKGGGPLALLQFCQYLQRTEETKLGQRERLLHQALQCIKAVATIDGGVNYLVMEPVFFSLMRTLAIHEAPVLDRKSSDPTIPTFSNSQTSVNVLVSVLARMPEMRDRILKETVADPNSFSNQAMDGDGGEVWKYSEWIAYLQEVMHVCGVESSPPRGGLTHEQLYAAPTGAAPPTGTEISRGGNFISSSKIVSAGAGLTSMGLGAVGSNFSLFSLDNIRRRRHTSTPSHRPPLLSPLSGIKFEAGEDREVLAYLTAHLELVSKLIFDMHVSGPALAFAQTVKDRQMEEIFERLRSEFIQHQDLSAQVEDLLIQLSMIPCLSRAADSAVSDGLPIIPPFDDALSYRTQHQRHSHSTQPERPISPMPPIMPHSRQKLQFQNRPRKHHIQQEQKRHHQLDNVKYDSQNDLKASDTASDTLSKSCSLESLARDQNAMHSDRRTGLGNYGNHAHQRPQYGGAVARSNSQLKPNHALQQQRLSSVGAGNVEARTRHATGSGPNGVHGGRETFVEGGGNFKVVSFKSSVVDEQREEDADASERSRSPIPAVHEGMSFPEGYKVRSGQQQDVSRISSATRRATVGDGASMTPTLFESSRLPTVPPKSKQRLFSMDTRGRAGQAHSKMEYTTSKLDEPRQHRQQGHYQQPTMDSKTSTNPRVLSTQNGSEHNVKDKPTMHKKTDSASSTDTFGQGRRLSLNSISYVITNTGNIDNGGMAPLAAAALHGNDPISQDGSASSSYSSTSSSAFSATSTSTSSTSPPSTQTKKHSILTAKTKASLVENNSRHPKARITSTVVTSATCPSLSSANSTTQFIKAEGGEKQVRRFRDVDFDSRIQEDVHKLALSSSSSHSNLNSKIRNARASDPKLDIQATDPKVLEAPIIVPENMSLARNQCIQSQVSQIVLPPLEGKGGGQTDVHVEKQVARAASGVTDNTSTSFQRQYRRVSVGSSIPISTSTTSTSSTKIWPSSLTGLALGGLRAIPRFYQQGSSRRSSLDISRLPSSVTSGTPTSLPSSTAPTTATENKAKFSERIKVFERS